MAPAQLAWAPTLLPRRRTTCPQAHSRQGHSDSLTQESLSPALLSGPTRSLFGGLIKTHRSQSCRQSCRQESVGEH